MKTETVETILTMEDVKKVQDIIYPIFLRFRAICEKYHLRYYLAYGTLLGAVRHKGFIPWDDDFDVTMPRPDFEVFLSVAQNELPSYYFLQNQKTDKNYYLHFAKILDLRTRFLQFTDQRLGTKDGVFIDIFPIDGLPSKKYSQKRQILLHILLSYRLWKKLCIPKELTRMQSKKGRIARVLSQIIFFWLPIRSCYNWEEHLYKKYSFSSSEFCQITTDSKIYRTADFGEGRGLFFVDSESKVPAGYLLLLKITYGDYSQLPPENQRLPHHFLAKFDLANGLYQENQKEKK